jgi:LysM repeat protein
MYNFSSTVKICIRIINLFGAIVSLTTVIGKLFGDDNTYKVKPGDTMFVIAKDHNMSLPELMKLNPDIKNPDKIYADKTVLYLR